MAKKEKNLEGHRWIVSTGLSRALLAGTDEKLQALTREERFFQSAVEPFEHIVETVTMLQRKAVLNDEQLDLLLTAISEALLNVSHHAYEDDAFKDDLLLLKGKRWWQCAGSIQKKTALFSLYVTLAWGFLRVSCLMMMVLALKTKYLL